MWGAKLLVWDPKLPAVVIRSYRSRNPGGSSRVSDP